MRGLLANFRRGFLARHRTEAKRQAILAAFDVAEGLAKVATGELREAAVMLQQACMRVSASRHTTEMVDALEREWFPAEALDPELDGDRSDRSPVQS